MLLHSLFIFAYSDPQLSYRGCLAGHDVYYPGAVLFDLGHFAFTFTSEPDLCPDAGHFPSAEPFQVLGLLSSIFLCFGFLFRFAGFGEKQETFRGEMVWTELNVP